MSTEERRRRAPVDDGLWILGLVGQAGSGKSTVAGALEGDGAWVLVADQIGHEVTDGDPEVRAALAADYGAAIYGLDGRLDRRRVAERVFADPAARARLDALVQPRILAEIRRRVASRRDAGFRGAVVIDAALMLEWGLEGDCDAVIAVVARRADQIAWLQQQRGWTAEEAAARFSAQRSPERFMSAADVTLENHGTADQLAGAARAAVAALRARPQR